MRSKISQEKKQPGKKQIVSLSNVSFGYDDDFLKDINLNIYEKNFLGIVGPNGGGKSTLIKLILGLLRPTKGSIAVFGKTPEKGRAQIGYLSQFENIDFGFPITVKQVVLQSRVSTMLKRFNKEDFSAAEQSMHRLKIADLRHKKLNELSGGEKQRVFVARALATQPRLLILDEPMANVDFQIQEEFYSILKELNKKIAIVVVDHNLEMLAKHAGEVACINKCNSQSLHYHIGKELNFREVCNI